MAILKLNGKEHFVNVSSLEIKEVKAGTYDVTYDGDRTFQVMGGTKSGGSSKEWFVKHELFYGDRWIHANSMIEAIKIGAQY